MNEILIIKFNEALENGKRDESLNTIDITTKTYLINYLVNENIYLELVDKIFEAIGKDYDYELQKQKIVKKGKPKPVRLSNGIGIAHTVPVSTLKNIPFCKIWISLDKWIFADGKGIRMFKKQVMEQIENNLNTKHRKL